MNDSFSKSLLKVYLKGAAFGGIIILLLYTAAAVLLTFKDLSDPVLNFLSLLICGAGGFCTAYKIGKEVKCGGLKIGAVTGCVVFCVITIIGIMLGNTFSLLTVLRLAVTAACSTAGGVAGVNRSGKRKMI